MRRPVVAANWKMHKTIREAEAFVDAFLPRVAGLRAVDVVLAPPFPALAAVGRRLAGSAVALAAQNVNPEPQGAFTGEVSGAMIADGIVDAARSVPGVAEVEAELTFDPPWTPDRMSDDAKFILGFG